MKFSWAMVLLLGCVGIAGEALGDPPLPRGWLNRSELKYYRPKSVVIRFASGLYPELIIDGVPLPGYDSSCPAGAPCPTDWVLPTEAEEMLPRGPRFPLTVTQIGARPEVRIGSIDATRPIPEDPEEPPYDYYPVSLKPGVTVKWSYRSDPPFPCSQGAAAVSLCFNRTRELVIRVPGAGEARFFERDTH